MKGFSVCVYRSARFGGDCSLGGISSKFSVLILLPTESTRKQGIIVPELLEARDNGIFLYYRPEFKDMIAAPEGYEDKERNWYMFGGNFIWTSDSRFPAKFPIKIHDRREGW